MGYEPKLGLIPSNNDPFYPNSYHESDHTPDCTCDEDEESCLLHEEYCDGCNRPAKYCGCP